MREPVRHPELALVLRAQINAHPLPKRRAVRANIHRNDKDTADGHTDEHALGLLHLEMQPTKDIARPSGVVVLDEIQILANRILEHAAIEALKEKTSGIAKDWGSISVTSGIASGVAITMGSVGLPDNLFEVLLIGGL